MLGEATAAFHHEAKASNRIIWTPGGPPKPYNNTDVQQHEKVVPDLLITCQGHTEQWCDGYQAGWADGQLGMVAAPKQLPTINITQYEKDNNTEANTTMPNSTGLGH